MWTDTFDNFDLKKQRKVNYSREMGATLKPSREEQKTQPSGTVFLKLWSMDHQWAEWNHLVVHKVDAEPII